MNTVHIYDYWSVASYLIDWVDCEKKINKSFSYQYFANKSGFKSKSSIANVLTGKKSFSVGALLGLSKALKLNKRETHYLEALLQYDSVKDDAQKQYYRDQILYLKPAQAAYNLERAYTLFLENWYVSHLRELVTLVKFNEDYKKLGSLLSPPVSAKETKRAVTLLVDLEFLKRHNDDDGIYYTQTNSAITTPQYLPKSLAIRNNQRKVIALGSEAIDRFKKDDRNICGATLTLSDTGVEAMNNLITEFQQKMIKITMDEEGKSDRVFQANIQFFPTSKKV